MTAAQTTRGHRGHFGKYRGTVVAVDDENHQGRIRAKVPEVLYAVETGWALPAASYAGPGVGMFAIPPVGAGVWIEFEAGDVSRPIWSGCWWASDHRPSSHDGTKATPPLKVLRSEQGLMLSLDDDGQTISVADEHGDNLLTIEVSKGQVTLKGRAKVVVEAPRIEVVEHSTHPMVFGDELMSYLNQLVQLFNTHIHPGELALGTMPVTPAPPVPSMTPPTPSLLSTKVTTG